MLCSFTINNYALFYISHKSSDINVYIHNSTKHFICTRLKDSIVILSVTHIYIYIVLWPVISLYILNMILILVMYGTLCILKIYHILTILYDLVK